jgi:hypothetical protein
MEESAMYEFKVPNPNTIVAMDRMHELRAEAERARLVRLVKADRPRRWDRILAGIGGLLVSVGERLRARHAPAVQQTCEVCWADHA